MFKAGYDCDPAVKQGSRIVALGRAGRVTVCIIDGIGHWCDGKGFTAVRYTGQGNAQRIGVPTYSYTADRSSSSSTAA